MFLNFCTRSDAYIICVPLLKVDRDLGNRQSDFFALFRFLYLTLLQWAVKKLRRPKANIYFSSSMQTSVGIEISSRNICVGGGLHRSLQRKQSLFEFSSTLLSKFLALCKSYSVGLGQNSASWLLEVNDWSELSQLGPFVHSAAFKRSRPPS